MQTQYSRFLHQMPVKEEGGSQKPLSTVALCHQGSAAKFASKFFCITSSKSLRYTYFKGIDLIGLQAVQVPSF